MFQLAPRHYIFLIYDYGISLLGHGNSRSHIGTKELSNDDDVDDDDDELDCSAI